MNMLPPVVVVGIDSVTGLQAARIFARNGIDVVGMGADPGHPCARTRACRDVVRVGRSEEELLEGLVRLRASLGGGAVLFPCTDQSVLAAARHRAALEGAYRMALPESRAVEVLLDKARFGEFARERGFPVPETLLLRSREDAEAAAREMPFPCVVKPPVKTPLWESGAARKAFRVSKRSELVPLWDRCSQWSSLLVAQEWVSGGDTDHITCNCYLAAGGEPLVTFTTRKLRQWPPDVGEGCLSEEWRDDEARALTVALFRAAGHRGFGYLEFKRDARTGRAVILEANVGRPTGRSASAEAGGVELHMTMYCDVAGLPLPAARTQRYGPTRWIYLRRDVQAAVRLRWRGAVSLRDVARSWKGPWACALFSWSDPVPFVADLARSARRALGSSVRPPPPSGAAGAAADRSLPPTRAGQPVTLAFGPDGVFHVEAVAATKEDAAALAKPLGPPRAVRAGCPDLVVRFVDEVPTPDLRLLDGPTAYGEDGLYVTSTRGGRAVARLSGQPHSATPLLLCARGRSDPPLLRPLVDLAAISRGWIPLHASAWTTGGVGVIAAGWGGSGKTGLLLAAVAGGAAFVGEDRVYLSRDGRSMVGLARPVRVRDWHVAALPSLRRMVSPGLRALARASRLLDAAAHRLAAREGAALSRKLLLRGVEAVRRRASTDISLTALLGTSGLELRASPDVVLVLERHAREEIEVVPLETDELVARLGATVEAELLSALRMQLALRFAWQPPSSALDASLAAVGPMLIEALAGKPAFLVRHPWPCALDELQAAVEQRCRPAPSGTGPEPRSRPMGDRTLGAVASS